MKNKKILALGFILILILIVILSISLLEVRKDNEGKLFDSETGKELEKIQVSHITHIMVKGSNFDIKAKETMIIYTFENDKLINQRNISVYENKEDAKEKYNSLTEFETENVFDEENNTVIYNYSLSNGTSKQRILELYSESNSSIELFEY